ERLDKARRARRDHDIASKGKAGAGTRGDAGDGGHDALLEVAQASDQRIVVALETLAEVAPSLAGRLPALAKVLPRAKAAAGTRDQQRADRLVAGRALE